MHTLLFIKQDSSSTDGKTTRDEFLFHLAAAASPSLEVEKQKTTGFTGPASYAIVACIADTQLSTAQPGC